MGTRAVRITVRGFAEGHFSKRELDTACGLLAEAFGQDAQAVSAGIMYVPECFNTREEWYALCREDELEVGACRRQACVLVFRRNKNGIIC